MRPHSETDLWLQFLTSILVPRASCHVAGLIERTLRDPFFRSWLMLAELHFHMIFINKKLSNMLPHPSPQADLTTRQHPFINKQMKSFSLIRRARKCSAAGFFQEVSWERENSRKDISAGPTPLPPQLPEYALWAHWLVVGRGETREPRWESLWIFYYTLSISHSRKYTINRIANTINP